MNMRSRTIIIIYRENKTSKGKDAVMPRKGSLKPQIKIWRTFASCFSGVLIEKKIRILKVLGSISDQIFEKYYWMFYRRCQFISEAINIICFPKNIHFSNSAINDQAIIKEIYRIYRKYWKKSNERFWRKKYKTDYFQIRLYIAASKCCFQTARPCFCMNDFWVFSLFYVLMWIIAVL